MLGLKKTVVYITRKKIWAGNFGVGKTKLVVVNWDGVNPTGAFRVLKKRFKAKSFKIVLGDDITYVFCLVIDSKKVTRGNILAESVKLRFDTVTSLLVSGWSLAVDAQLLPPPPHPIRSLPALT